MSHYYNVPFVDRANEGNQKSQKQKLYISPNFVNYVQFCLR